ncbi:hypothetical protein Taro_031893 [Colocasia esculenta]|uniref:Uncharacterized protein n=1 Tax=Colocasia esculenta TaxID=4460 RepID=A0A843VJY8_COLES|nr:hypothetical protein [Colocasia esculenta]
MRAVADELKVIDLHMPKVPQQKGSTECGFMVLYFIFYFILAALASFGTNDYPSFLTADWFSQEEYEKFMEDLQGKRIHIDAQSASTSKEQIRDIKLTQQSSTSSSIASVGDAYEQVMGRDRTGRVRGIGTGPTPKSLWGSRSEQKLRQDNDNLKQQIDALEERMKKLESRGNNESSARFIGGEEGEILNFSGQVVANGILMFDDNDNVVMGKKLGGEYYEVSILIAHDPTASLFIKDADRKNMNDVVGSHIIWFREYVELEDD